MSYLTSQQLAAFKRRTISKEFQFCRGTIIERPLVETFGIYYVVKIVHDGDTFLNDHDCYDDEKLQAYSRGEWGFVGVIVELRHGCFTLESKSLWGVEDTDNDYFCEIANNLLEQAKTAYLANME